MCAARPTASTTRSSNRGIPRKRLETARHPIRLRRQIPGRAATDPTCYKNRKLPPEGTDYLHEVDYAEVNAAGTGSIKASERLLALAEAQPTAILCSEEDPSQCHRHHLIARYLMGGYPDVSVQHIRGDAPYLAPIPS